MTVKTIPHDVYSRIEKEWLAMREQAQTQKQQKPHGPSNHDPDAALS